MINDNIKTSLYNDSSVSKPQNIIYSLTKIEFAAFYLPFHLPALPPAQQQCNKIA